MEGIQRFQEAKILYCPGKASNAGGVLEGLYTHFHHLGYHHRAAAATWREIIEEAQARFLCMLKAWFGNLSLFNVVRDYLMIRFIEVVMVRVWERA